MARCIARNALQVVFPTTNERGVSRAHPRPTSPERQARWRMHAPYHLAVACQAQTPRCTNGRVKMQRPDTAAHCCPDAAVQCDCMLLCRPGNHPPVVGNQHPQSGAGEDSAANLVCHNLLDRLRWQEALCAQRWLGGVRSHKHHCRQPLDLRAQKRAEMIVCLPQLHSWHNMGGIATPPWAVQVMQAWQQIHDMGPPLPAVGC